MTTKHTPGPWIVTEGDNVYAKRNEGPSLPVASCAVSRSVTTKHRQANARLIAAAPDMLEALPGLIECAEILAAQCRVAGDEAHANMWQARADAGKASLAKAEGRA